MPRSALPSHLDEQHEIDAAFPDDSQFANRKGLLGLFGKAWRWYKKKTKTWFAFSYRCTERWARWRVYPKVLFAVGGEGVWRWEAILPPHADLYSDDVVQPAFYYLSRIQYFKRWHVSVQWPLIFTMHFYPKAKDMPLHAGTSYELDGKLWFFYWNHFDADLVYWMVKSMYLGKNWK